MMERFSSTTRISSKPSANSWMDRGSSGQGIPTLNTLIPISAPTASVIPMSSSACRTSRYALPDVTMPSLALELSRTTLELVNPCKFSGGVDLVFVKP